MEERIRSFDRLVAGGTQVDEDGNIIKGPQPLKLFESTMIDWHKKHVRKDGLLPPSPLYLFQVERTPMTVTRSPSVLPWTYHGWSVHHEYTPNTPFKTTGLAHINENLLYTNRLLSKTFPFRSEFSVPVAIKELLDVSTLFQFAAQGFASYIGSQYLKYRFGLLPFVSDIRTLAQITKKLESRIKEYNTLAKTGKLRRKHVKLDVLTDEQTSYDVTLHTEGAMFIDGTRTSRYTMEVYGSVTWKPKEGTELKLSGLGAFNKAVESLFDLGELDAETVWKLLPWSWLVDYFVDFSSYLESLEWNKLVYPLDITITRVHRTHAKEEATQYNSEVTILNPGNFHVKLIERDVVNPTEVPTGTFQFLDFQDWKILAALATKFIT